MATTDENTVQINKNTNAINGIIENSQNIEDFTLQTPVELTSQIAITNNSDDFKITVQGLIDLLSQPFNVITKVADYTAVANDYILADSSTGVITITLPSAIGIIGQQINITKAYSSLNDVTVDTTLSQTIIGNLTEKITKQYTNATFISDGANWFIK